MKVPVIDNGGQWTHREWRVLRDLGVDCQILPNTAAPEEIAGADAVVLSGGALSLESSTEPLGRVAEWIDVLRLPVLGICVGHQYLARHYGGTVSHAAAGEFGRVEVELSDPVHPLWTGLSSPTRVWANHNDQVTQPPPGWTTLARSTACPVQAMAAPDRPLFGVQFHPEVEHTVGGRRIFENFLALARGETPLPPPRSA
ncbi:MAG: GMP synthase subunit A [Thermoplasmata archaeon]|nr:GMP synthase subunit A [Thermoplasmata archaeon]